MREAVQATLRTIELRARLYRNLVILVAALIVIPPVAGLVCRSWLPLVALIALPVCVGVHLVVDTLVVRRWSRHVQSLCTRDAVPTEEFVRTVRTLRNLPPSTTEGMLLVLTGRRNDLGWREGFLNVCRRRQGKGSGPTRTEIAKRSR